MHPLTRLKQNCNSSHGSADSRQQLLTREQAVAQSHLPANDRCPTTAQLPLRKRIVSVYSDDRFGPFSQSFDLQKALETATRASEAEKRELLQEASRLYASLDEQMTFREVTSFWALAMSCSPFHSPMDLEVKHVKRIALLGSQHIHQEADKIEMISLIHVLGSLMANRQLNVKIAGATRTMDLCSAKLLAELVFLFAQSLKPEEGKEWDANKLSFMALLMQQLDLAFDCSIYRIVDLFLIDSLKSGGMIEICMHLISEEATFSSLRAFGRIMQYVEYEVPPEFHPSLWKCAHGLDLTQMDTEAIKDLLAALFHENHFRQPLLLAEPVAFLHRWANILRRAEYQKDVQNILDCLCRSVERPGNWSDLREKLKSVVEQNAQ